MPHYYFYELDFDWCELHRKCFYNNLICLLHEKLFNLRGVYEQEK